MISRKKLGTEDNLQNKVNAQQSKWESSISSATKTEKKWWKTSNARRFMRLVSDNLTIKACTKIIGEDF